MLVRPVVDLDFNEIGKWFEKRNMRVPNRVFFPRTGYIADGIAVGFIYFTDSAVSIIDCYISNPESAKKDRDLALDQITLALINVAKLNNYKMIKCDTKINAVQLRAEKNGFKYTGKHDSFAMEI